MVKHRNLYPKENEAELKDTIQKLRAKIKKVQKENKQLKTDLRTLRRDFSKKSPEIKKADSEKIEDLINESKPTCPDCGKSLKETKVPKVGVLRLCENCEFREVLK